VGGGPERSLSLCELTALCEKYTGRRIPISGVPENRPGDIITYITDNAKVTGKTGWKPEISSERTIRDIAEWVEENSESLKPILT